MRYNYHNLYFLKIEKEVYGHLLGLMAALCWGSADFWLARTRLVGFYRTLIFMQIVGFVGLTLYCSCLASLIAAISRGLATLGLAALAALLNIASSLALYRAFEIGVLTIVSPIAASYAALTALLALLSGEVTSAARGGHLDRFWASRWPLRP